MRPSLYLRTSHPAIFATVTAGQPPIRPQARSANGSATTFHRSEACTLKIEISRIEAEARARQA